MRKMFRNAKKRSELQFAVIGIGAFGGALARKLNDEGAYVIAVDNNIEHIQEIKDEVADAICFDATEPELLEEHGITNVDVAIISIGESFEPNAIIAMHLKNSGVEEIYGRASSKLQEQILRQIGITDVIYPERQVAERMGVSLVRRGMAEVFDLGDNMGVFEINAPEAMIGYSLKDLNLRKRYGMNMITIKRRYHQEKSKENENENENEYEYHSLGIPDPEVKLREHDHIVLVGTKEDCDKLMDTN